MRIMVVKEFEFDSAHHLPNYDGPCCRVHGHRYVLQIGLLGEIDEKTGMVMDFTRLKRAVSVDVLDHQNLNELTLEGFPAEMPTAENMVEWFVTRLRDLGMALPNRTELVFVRLYETPTSYAEWRKSYDA